MLHFTHRPYRRAALPNGFKLSVQFRQLLRKRRIPGEIARTRGAQRQTRKDTLQPPVPDAAPLVAVFADGVLQGADGLLAFTHMSVSAYAASV